MITKPAIILADEPTGNLDTQSSLEVMGLLKQTSERFCQTIVMITHNMNLAQLVKAFDIGHLLQKYPSDLNHREKMRCMENSTYSILSPEGFASILWKNEKRAKEAANLMKMTAKDLLDLGVIEKILPEGNEASEFKVITDFLQVQILDFIYNMSLKNEDEIVASRETRFRSF